MKLSYIILLAGVVSLAACKKSSKEDEKYGAGGLCTSGAINAFNYINMNSDSTSDYTLREVQKQCVNLKNSLGGGECKAVVVATGQTTWASFSRVAANCTGVDVKLKNGSTPTTTLPEVGSSNICSDKVFNISTRLSVADYALGYKTEAELKQYSDDCKTLKSELGYGYCSKTKYSVTPLRYSDYASVCVKIQAEVDKRAALSTSDDIELRTYSKEIMLTPADEWTMKHFLLGDRFFENGVSVSGTTAQKSFCKLSGYPTSAEVLLISQGRTTWKVKSQNNYFLTLRAQAYPIDIVCELGATSSKWDAKELRKVFGGLVKVELQ